MPPCRSATGHATGTCSICSCPHRMLPSQPGSKELAAVCKWQGANSLLLQQVLLNGRQPGKEANRSAQQFLMLAPSLSWPAAATAKGAAVLGSMPAPPAAPAFPTVIRNLTDVRANAVSTKGPEHSERWCRLQGGGSPLNPRGPVLIKISACTVYLLTRHTTTTCMGVGCCLAANLFNAVWL